MQPSIRLFWGEPLMNCWYLRLPSFSSNCRLHCNMSYLKTKHQPLIGHKTRAGSAFAQCLATGWFWPVTFDGASVCATTCIIGQQEKMVNSDPRTTNWLTSILPFHFLAVFLSFSLLSSMKLYNVASLKALFAKRLLHTHIRKTRFNRIFTHDHDSDLLKGDLIHLFHILQWPSIFPLNDFSFTVWLLMQ